MMDASQNQILDSRCQLATVDMYNHSWITDTAVELCCDAAILLCCSATIAHCACAVRIKWLSLLLLPPSLCELLQPQLSPS
jgi:hypothetical protein